MIAKLLKYLFLLLVLVLVVSTISYFRGINSFNSEEGKDVRFVITQGEGVKKIGKNLADKDLIGSKFYFEIYVWRKKKETEFQAGTYNLNSRMSIVEIVEILTSGLTVKNERKITIIEGWNLRDVGQYFEREGMFQSEELLELVGFPKIDYRYNKDMERPKDYSDKLSLLKDKPKYYSLEGYLFPDTYIIYNDASLEDIVLKMLHNFDSKLTSKMREDIKKQEKTIYEIITMASVIEKEVRDPEEMKIVSGIFWKRIDVWQPLQSCASLAYILGINKPVYSIEDTKIESPYNTYQNYGLPPGPICNPGLAAIEAAIYPKETEYNYFLSKKENGETVFSRTIEEHNLNKAKYLK